MNYLKSIIFLFAINSISTFSQTGHESKVPHQKFSTVKEIQELELESNILIKRFRKSREKMAGDIHYPAYHYVNPEGRLNDPNGLCFWNGQWHLFYQGYPPEDPRQHWGHAVSNDLVHWRDLPYAIYPSPESKVYSGTTYVEDNRVLAMYFGVGEGIMVAESSDPYLLNWEKITGKAVIPLPEEGKIPYSVYDPCIWKKGGYYYCLSGGTTPDGPGNKKLPQDFLFRSADLKTWEYLHPFVEKNHYSLVGDDGACPYFWPIGNDGKYILLYFSHKSGGKYLIGDYDTARDKFVVTDGGNFNNGPAHSGGIHAPSAYPDGNGGVVVLFNMNSGRELTGDNYSYMMTLPCLLTLTGQGKLSVKPVEAIKSLRDDVKLIEKVHLPANEDIFFDDIHGKSMELEFSVNMRESKCIGINVFCSPGKEEYTRIIFYKEGGTQNREYRSGEILSAISIDNSRSSLSSAVQQRIAETAEFFLGKDELLKLRVFIDNSIVEVFVNDRQFAALRAYPEREDSNRIMVRSIGNDAELLSLKAWRMKKFNR